MGNGYMGILPYGQTDMTENITFPQLRWRIVIHDKHKKNSLSLLLSLGMDGP